MSRNRFLPFNDGHGGGRPAGSRNKLQGDFLKVLAADFAEFGAGVIRIARIEKPVEYLKVIASVLPARQHQGEARQRRHLDNRAKELRLRARTLPR